MAKLTMLLARGPGLPEGDLNDRLVMHLSLTPQGHLDSDAFETASQPWLSARDRPGLNTKTSELTLEDDTWALKSTNSDDDPLWVVEGHVFRPGELVVLRRPDGEELLFRIVAVDAD